MTLHPLVPWWLLLLVAGGLAAVCVLALRSGAPRLVWARRAAVVGVVTLVGLGPSVPSATSQTAVANVELFFVVDRTGSMAAQDWGAAGQTRLDGVRHDLVDLTRALPGARCSIIAFDSGATRQLPLTTDARAVQSWAQTLHQEVTYYSTGSLTDRPLDALRAALEAARQTRPQDTRLVFFLSDGEQTAGGTPRSYAELAPLVDGGAVLGYGTAEGGRMREYTNLDEDAENPAWIEDWETGEPAVSRIDEATLRATAEQLGVPYAHRTDESSTAPLVAGIDPELTAQDGRREVRHWDPVVWPLAAVLAGLLGWEAWAWTARLTPGRRVEDGVRR